MPTLPIAMSCGDPAGIGPEVAIRAWLAAKNSPETIPAFGLLGDIQQLCTRAAQLSLEVPMTESKLSSVNADFSQALPVIPLNNKLNDAFGTPDVANAAGVIEAIERSVEALFTGEARALVTCPIAKKPLYDAGFAFPGHTEFLASLAEARTGQAYRPIMLLDGPELRTVPVTIHIPLSEVPIQLKESDIFETIMLTARDLRERYQIENPRLAVSGLNPHAGEGGALGKEDEVIVLSAIKAAQAAGVDAYGPLPADTMFHKRAREGYDVAICMYHDQALIPAKALAFDEAVNATMGLPFIRTSPDHGTAFDIAVKGIARPDSLIAAIKLADRLSA